MGTFYLSFDVPVSVNKMYIRRQGGNGVTLSDEARVWKHGAEMLAASQWEGQPPLDGKLSVTYHFYGTKMDWDNGCKLLGDAMNKIVYNDDSQIIQAHVYMHRKEKSDDPHVDVEVQTLG